MHVWASTTTGSIIGDRLISDNRRQNGLQAIGVVLLRCTGSDLRERPTQILTEVRRALDRAARPMAVSWQHGAKTAR